MKMPATRILPLAAMVSVALNAPHLMAQEADVERIAVTGSHIKRTDMEGPSPVRVISAEELASTGANDLIGALQKLPIVGNGSFSTQANSSDDTANGGSSISLRGLGADSTLVLINGRRVAVSPFAKDIDVSFVDINMIPMAAIKRVDILKDGASALYGSDAIAGVVNVILRDDFDGLEVSARVGDSADGGGEESNISLLWGSTSNTSTQTVVLDYFKRGDIFYGDRDYAASADQSWRGGDDFRSSSGIPGTIRLNAGALTADERADLEANNPGAFTWYADTYGNDTCDPDLITTHSFGTLCRYDYAPVMSLMPSTERVSFNYNGTREINENVTAYAELTVQHSSTFVQGAASPSFDELFLAADSANHPFADDSDHPLHGLPLTMRRRLVEIGNRQKKVDTDFHRLILGAEGEMNGWMWDAAYSNIRSASVERGVNGFPNALRVQEALDTGLWNPFEPSANSQEALDFMETTTTRYGQSKNESFDITLSGDLMEFGAGSIAMAVGFEYRKQSISDNPDSQYLRGEIFGTEATQANGKRNNKSLFAEFSIPATDELEIQLAVRHENYSDFGTTTDPKVAFRWAPSDDVAVRGSWGTAFRAPSLVQLGLGKTDESPNLVDPWRCALTGDDFDCDPREYTSTVQGNPNLKPEESENFNLGMIWEMTESFNVGLDYWSYEQDNLIKRDAQFVVNKLGMDPAFVQREATVNGIPGQITNIFDTFVNFGGQKTSGVDLDAAYTLNNEMGDFRFSYNLTYVLNFEEQRPDGNVDANGNPTFMTESLEGRYQHPEVRWTASVDWNQDVWAANLRVNYIGEYQDNVDGGTPDRQIDSFTTVDTSVKYLGIEQTTLTLGASNLLNEEPPFSASDFYGFDDKTHSAVGRFVYLKATYQF